MQVTSFRSLGLADSASDAVVWQACQAADVILFTGNRNAEGPDSLEEVIRRENRPHHLPVITVGSLTKLQQDHDYAEQVAERLMQYLMDVENIRGTGRLYVP